MVLGHAIAAAHDDLMSPAQGKAVLDVQVIGMDPVLGVAGDLARDVVVVELDLQRRSLRSGVGPAGDQVVSCDLLGGRGRLILGAAIGVALEGY